MIPFVNLGAQLSQVRPEIDRAISRVLSSGNFVLGEEVEAFEAEFAAYCEARYCVATDSGTSALHLALLGLGIGPGDEVISVANTFIATIEAISHAGALPVFVDVDPISNNLDARLIEAAITSRSKAIIPVHLHGNPADMDAISDVARRHHLFVVEDAAQAHGARYKSKRVGALGDAGCFSFYPTKNLGAYGESGAVVTNDGALAAALRRLRDHGQSKKYVHELVGYNYRMDALQAAILRAKLPHLDRWNDTRRRLAADYRRLLAGALAQPKPECCEAEGVYHLFAIYSSERDALARHLLTNGVECAVHYPIPIHLQSAYAALGYATGDLPNAERSSKETVSLPIYPELGDDDICHIALAVSSFTGSTTG